MKQDIFSSGASGAYENIAKRLCLVILCSLLSACLMTKHAVFGPADFVPIKGLEGHYRLEKESKSPEKLDTARIEALGDGRYRIVGVGIRPGKTDKVETIETGFIPLRDNFYLGVVTIPGVKERPNLYIYMLAAMGAGDIQFWNFWPNSENRENIDLKASLARHGLSINESGPMGLASLITSGQNDLPSPNNLKAFFKDVVGGAAQVAELEKSGWMPTKKLVKKN